MKEKIGSVRLRKIPGILRSFLGQPFSRELTLSAPRTPCEASCNKAPPKTPTSQMWRWIPFSSFQCVFKLMILPFQFLSGWDYRCYSYALSAQVREASRWSFHLLRVGWGGEGLGLTQSFSDIKCSTKMAKKTHQVLCGRLLEPDLQFVPQSSPVNCVSALISLQGEEIRLEPWTGLVSNLPAHGSPVCEHRRTPAVHTR